VTVHKCFGLQHCALLHAVIATLSGTSDITCMSMCMHTIKKLGQHANSAVSLMLPCLMGNIGIEWFPAFGCTGHSNESLTVFALPSVTECVYGLCNSHDDKSCALVLQLILDSEAGCFDAVTNAVRVYGSANQYSRTQLTTLGYSAGCGIIS